MSAPIRQLSLSQIPVFLLNSCLSLFSAATSQWHPFSRSYGVILPSSLTMLLPPALGFSPHPPVSVYGTGAWQTIAAFLDRRGHMLHYFSSLHITASSHAQRICLLCDYPVCTGLSISGPCFPPVSPQFCYHAVQEYQPVVHRLRFSASP